jgi:hypothetical protein
MSVWPVASHTCTPDGTGIIGATKHRARGQAHPRRHRRRREPAFRRRDRSRSGRSSSPQIGSNATALPRTRSASRQLDTARRHGLGPSPEPRARQALSRSPHAATQRSNLECQRRNKSRPAGRRKTRASLWRGRRPRRAVSAPAEMAGFRSRGGRGLQEAVVISPVLGSAVAAARAGLLYFET